MFSLGGAACLFRSFVRLVSLCSSAAKSPPSGQSAQLSLEKP